MVEFGLWLPRLKGGVRRAHFHCASLLPLPLLFLPAFIVFVSLSTFPSQLSPSCFFPVCSPHGSPCVPVFFRSLPWEVGSVFGCYLGKRCVAGNAVDGLATGVDLFWRPSLSLSVSSQKAALSQFLFCI